jgi:Domain of unknown function (DUF4845)
MNRIAARSRQDGMTYLGMLILLIVIAFFAIVLIKVAPLYMEYFKVKSSLDSLVQDTKDNQAALSPAEIESSLLKRLSINDVQHVTKDDIKITREGRKTVVVVDYEARVTLFDNIDLVARFPDNRVELGGS